MEYKILGKKNDIALIITDEIVIKDTQSALDMILSGQYLIPICSAVVIHIMFFY
jgi:hypothetical protein